MDGVVNAREGTTRENAVENLDLEKLVADLGPQITAALKERVVAAVTQRAEWALAEAVSKEVVSFMEKEVAPLVRAHLLENKEGLIQAAQTVAETASKSLTIAMMDSFNEKMKSSYYREKILKELF